MSLESQTKRQFGVTNDEDFYQQFDTFGPGFYLFSV